MAKLSPLNVNSRLFENLTDSLGEPVIQGAVSRELLSFLNQLSALKVQVGTDQIGIHVQTDGTVRIGDGVTNYVEYGTDGEIILHGTARVTVDKYISASGVKAPGGKPATEIQHGIAGAWQFGDEAVAGNQETISGTMKLPTQMDKTVVPIFKCGWSANGVSPGVGEWQLSYRYMTPGDDTTAAAQDVITATGTASATSNGLVITSFIGMELPSATDQAMFFEIMRLSAAGSNDTIVDTLELHGMLFTHTVNKHGTAL